MCLLISRVVDIVCIAVYDVRLDLLVSKRM